jgi:phosphatidylglycerol lysyltransferase
MESESQLVLKKPVFPWELWGVRVTSLMTFVMGFINLISAVQPALVERLRLIDQIFPLEVRHGSRITSALAGFALIVMAVALWRRKRTAWILTVGLVAISIVSHLIKGLDFEEASVGVALMVLLIVFRRAFHASSDIPSVKQGLIVLGIAFGFTLIYGTVGFYLLDKHFRVSYNLIDAARQAVVMFTSFYNPGLEPITGFGRYFGDSIYIIGIGTVGFALLMLIRPVLMRLPATVEERNHAEKIVNQFGKTALARATLFEDKSYYFGTENSMIAYGSRNRGAIVLGDPIGPENEIPEAIQAFKQFCLKNDWTPAYVSVQPEFLTAYAEAGYETICLGYEAIVDLHQFTLEGSENKSLRNTISRMERNGFKAEVHRPPLDDKLMNSLRQISDDWLTLHHGGEMHFSDGWFNDSYVRNGLVMVIHDPDGNPTAFTNLVPEYQKNELTIDLMRRYEKVENGTMEFMFSKMLLWAKENGYDSFSLGLSAIVGVGEKPDDPRVEKALHTLSEYGSRFFNFRGLHDFKEKFHPDWQPRYLVYPGVASLPLVLNTLLQVHSGNHYLWKFLKK